jgi:hypothetical protein
MPSPPRHFGGPWQPSPLLPCPCTQEQPRTRPGPVSAPSPHPAPIIRAIGWLADTVACVSYAFAPMQPNGSNQVLLPTPTAAHVHSNPLTIPLLPPVTTAIFPRRLIPLRASTAVELLLRPGREPLAQHPGKPMPQSTSNSLHAMPFGRTTNCKSIAKTLTGER